ncbi:hypothetical protein TGAM01_v205362 [Trichoderma gamsii]|uniref:Uncharacterized protein n=1 Tax=Trichoderma gamsii TaxID=398673 RepID=A0A2P4ZNR1_9HYPO|nr:hypothetical protein TGAM01_v205362 [Trichoderma gamsii]PON25925.1 hypothetical protein TGAM01_v205362 [Trichoderma gamsii]
MSYAVLESIAAAPRLVLLVSQRPPSRPARRRLPRWAGWSSSTSVAPKRVANKNQRPFRKGVRQTQKTQWPSTSRKGAAHQGSTVCQQLLGRSDAWYGALIALCHVAGAAPTCQAARQTPVARTEESMEMSFLMF